MAPTVNKFWKLRNSHGRKKLFETPELLMQAAEEYFEWVDNNPWMKQDGRKKLFETPELLMQAAEEYFEWVDNNPWMKQDGRKKLFETPELLMQAAEEYFEWVDNNPWMKQEPIKSGDRTGELIAVPVQRPYTLKGFCCYLGASESFWRNFRKNENLSDEFEDAINRIESIIYTHKFEGAAVGAFNANIIARDLGLRDQNEITGANNDPLFPAVIVRIPEGVNINLPSNIDGEE